MPETENAATIIDWLIATGRDKDDLGEMPAGLCERLAARGAPLWRVMLAMRAVDPTATVFNWHFYYGVDIVPMIRRTQSRARSYRPSASPEAASILASASRTAAAKAGWS
jgi:hypothetical protein